MYVTPRYGRLVPDGGTGGEASKIHEETSVEAVCQTFLIGPLLEDSGDRERSTSALLW